MRLVIVGYGLSGKDTLGEYFEEFGGMKAISSSFMAADIFIFDALKEKYNYSSFHECYTDRRNLRSEWYNLIAEYNREEPTRLAAEIFKRVPIYTGMRRDEELLDCKRRWGTDLMIIWVDASERVPVEGKESCTISKENADIIIENNGTLEEFKKKAETLISFITRNTRTDTPSLRGFSKGFSFLAPEDL